jgi:hypothetical protein
MLPNRLETPVDHVALREEDHVSDGWIIRQLVLTDAIDSSESLEVIDRGVDEGPVLETR